MAGVEGLAAYDALRIASIVVCVGVAALLCRRLGIPVRFTLAVSALCVPASAAAARLLDVVEYWGAGTSMVDAFSRNGSSIYGGLLASLVIVWGLTWSRDVPTLAFLDGCAASLALGEAITRLGCFTAGCCYGVEWHGPLAVTFPPGSFAFTDMVERGLLQPVAAHTPPLHPVQLYSAAAMFAVAAGFVARLSHRRFDGELFCIFLVSYGTLRLLVTPFRVEALDSMRAFSVLFIVAGALGIAIGRRFRAPARAIVPAMGGVPR